MALTQGFKGFNSLQVEWSAVTNAVRYDIHFGTVSASLSLVKTTKLFLDFCKTELAVNTEYFFQVLSFNSSDTLIDTSNELSFTTKSGIVTPDDLPIDFDTSFGTYVSGEEPLQVFTNVDRDDIYISTKESETLPASVPSAALTMDYSGPVGDFVTDNASAKFILFNPSSPPIFNGKPIRVPLDNLDEDALATGTEQEKFDVYQDPAVKVSLFFKIYNITNISSSAADSFNTSPLAVIYIPPPKPVPIPSSITASGQNISIQASGFGEFTSANYEIRFDQKLGSTPNASTPNEDSDLWADVISEDNMALDVQAVQIHKTDRTRASMPVRYSYIVPTPGEEP